MSLFRNQRMSRRGAVAGLLGTFTLLQTESGGSAQIGRPAPVDLGHGLEIRDYRLFPTEDVMRFIVELHNTTDTAVDTPSVGLMLPNLDDRANFAWAAPVSPVLHPLSSGCLIGVSPNALISANDWGTPEWMLCEEVSTSLAESLEQWNIDFTYELAKLEPTHARALYEVKNNGASRAMGVSIHGNVWDSNGRICGALIPSSVQFVKPGESSEQLINVHPRADYIANPFSLIDTVEGVAFTCSLQPESPSVTSACPAVMPWNR